MRDAVAAGAEHAAAATAIDARVVKRGSGERGDYLRKPPPDLPASGEKELSQNVRITVSKCCQNVTKVAFRITRGYFGVTKCKTFRAASFDVDWRVSILLASVAIR